MTVAAHLAAVEAALAGEVVPLTVGHSRASAAISQSLDILRRLISNATAEPVNPSLMDEAIAALGIVSAADAGVADVSENVDRFFGGTSVRAAAESATMARISAGDFGSLRSVALWESEGLIEADAALSAMRNQAKSNDAEILRIDPDRLLAFLRVRLPDYPDVAIVDFRQIAGGRSKQTAIFSLVNAPNLPDRLVIRRDHPVGISDSSVKDEYPLIVKLFEAGIKVAQPVIMEASKGPLGGAFMISAAIAGQSAGELFEPRLEPSLAQALAREVGRLHAQPIEHYIGLTGRLQQLTLTDHEARLAGYADMWRQCEGPTSPAMQLALAWLKANLHLAAGTPTIVHGDLGFHNVLADGDSFNALLDWEFTTIANPAEDLGFVRATIEKMMPWDDWMVRYHDAGGPQVPSAEVNFYAIWGWVRLAALVAYARWLLNTGAIKDVAFAQSSLVDLNRILQRVAEGLTRVL